VSAVRVVLPSHLRTLAGTGAEVVVEVPGDPTIAALLDALERAHPQLGGTVRDRRTGVRRAYMRYFACGRDLSHEPPGTPLPDAVVSGAEPFAVVGAIAGG
jgi:sulfur-carrier protein